MTSQGINTLCDPCPADHGVGLLIAVSIVVDVVVATVGNREQLAGLVVGDIDHLDWVALEAGELGGGDTFVSVSKLTHP